MWLQMKYTYAHNASFKAIASGKYDNIRLMAGDSQSEGLNPTTPPLAPWLRVKDAVAGKTPLKVLSAVCYYFAEALTDQHLAAGKAPANHWSGV